MGTDDRWEKRIQVSGGALLGSKFWWAGVMQGFQTLPPDPETFGEGWRAAWLERLEDQRFWAVEWLRHQSNDASWRHGSVVDDHGAIETPTYFMGGWEDLYRDTPFRLAEHLRAPFKLLMGPWAHLYPQRGVPGPEVDFMVEALRWWDRWLKGRTDAVPEEPPLRFWMRDPRRPDPAGKEAPGRWVEEPGWPSPNVEEQLWLNAGALGDTRPLKERPWRSPPRSIMVASSARSVPSPWMGTWRATRATSRPRPTSRRGRSTRR